MLVENLLLGDTTKRKNDLRRARTTSIKCIILHYPVPIIEYFVFLFDKNSRCHIYTLLIKNNTNIEIILVFTDAGYDPTKSGSRDFQQRCHIRALEGLLLRIKQLWLAGRSHLDGTETGVACRK